MYNEQENESEYDPNQDKTEPATNFNDAKVHVIGLNLKEWPDSIKRQFLSKMKVSFSEIKGLFDKTLFIKSSFKRRDSSIFNIS